MVQIIQRRSSTKSKYPSKDLWFKLFKEEAPPKLNLKLTNDEIVQHLRNSFLKNKPNINFKIITTDNIKIENFNGKNY